MTDHTLKTVSQFWDAIYRGEKTFEVRKNDRGFQKGDTLILERWEHNQHGALVITWPRRLLSVKITYLLQGGQFGIEPAYCVLGFKRVTIL